jgi:outer membrane protein OmpA-like peptidoglycan-associated protein
MRYITFLVVALLLSLGGCTLRNSQVTACQTEKEQLLTTIRTQRDTTRSLQNQVASLESRLDQSEKELARGGTGTRLSSVPSGAGDPPRSIPISTPISTSTSKAQPPIRSEGLPWRSPGGKVEQDPPPRDNRRGGINGGGSGNSLLALARRDRRLEYDASARAAKVNVPVAFDDQSATITGEGKRQLDDLARLLKADDTRDLRVMVAGFAAGKPPAAGASDEERFTSARQLGTARAQAVADYLDRHGIAQERLAVSGTGTRSDGAASGVQVYLLEADAPAVAWPADRTIRR